MVSALRVFFFKQKTAYEMRISDWSSDVCSSDLAGTGDTFGAVVGKAKLVQGDAPRIEGLQIIWKQDPKVPGRGHFSHRLAFSPDGQYLFITSGERQKFDPAQDMGKNLGKVIRLKPDGSIPADNPFADKGGVTRSEEHTSELQSLMRISYAVFCLKKKKTQK